MRAGKCGARPARAALAVLGLIVAAAVLTTEARGQQPSDPHRKGPGISSAQAKKPAPTYTKDVAAILQSKCQNCHRRHQVGPFALETYEQARKRSHDIAAVTEERSMPPWKPTAGVGPKLKHDQSLTHAEIAILAAWAEAGAPRGDPKDLPPPPTFAEGWKLGPPDLILEPSRGLPVPASGPDVYRCFVLPTNLARDSLPGSGRLRRRRTRGRAPPHRLHRHDRPGPPARRGRPGAGLLRARPGRDSRPTN